MSYSQCLSYCDLTWHDCFQQVVEITRIHEISNRGGWLYIWINAFGRCMHLSEATYIAFNSRSIYFYQSMHFLIDNDECFEYASQYTWFLPTNMFEMWKSEVGALYKQAQSTRKGWCCHLNIKQNTSSNSIKNIWMNQNCARFWETVLFINLFSPAITAQVRLKLKLFVACIKQWFVKRDYSKKSIWWN